MRKIINFDSDNEHFQSQTMGISMQLLFAMHSIMQTTQSTRIVMIGNTTMNQLVNKICLPEQVYLTHSLSLSLSLPSQ
jgi:hypothetical protein